MAGAAPSLAACDRAAVKRCGLPAFCELATRQIPVVKRYIPGKLQRVLAEQFEALYRGEDERGEVRVTVMNVPPGHGKSTVTSVLGPAWIWIEDPAYQLLCASHSTQLLVKLATWSRDLMLTPWFRERWGDIVVEGAGITKLTTFAGGFRFGTTVGGGSLIGTHGGMFIADDPMNPDPKVLKSAAGKALANVGDWFRGKVLTRAAVGETLKVCVNMQRLHPEDPSGLILSSPLAQRAYFRHVNLPYEYEPESGAFCDWRTRAGETLWPEDPTRDEFIETIAASEGGKLGSVYRAHVQQDPMSGTDRIFRAETFQDLGGVTPDDCSLLILSVDPSFTGKATSDDCAIEVWGLCGEHFYCFDSNAEKRTFRETCAVLRAMFKRWAPHRVLVEAAANGNAIADVLIAEGLPVELVTPNAKESKEHRARFASYHFTAMAVHFDKAAAWYAEKARLLVRFTGAAGGRDDTVDTTSQAIRWLDKRGRGTSRMAAAMAECADEMRAAGIAW